MAKDLREHAPGVLHTLTTVGGGAQGQVNLAEIQVVLTPSKQRPFTQQDLMAWVRERFGNAGDAKVRVQEIQPSAAAASERSPSSSTCAAATWTSSLRVTDALKKELGNRQGLVDLDTTYRGGKPEVGIHIDRDRAADLGVPVSSIATTVRYLMAGDPVSELKDGVRSLRHHASHAARRALAHRADPEPQVRSIDRRPGRSRRTSCTSTRGEGPSQIERQARQRQITVLAGLQGLPLGEANKAVDTAAKKVIPPDLVTGYVGMADTMARVLRVHGHRAVPGGRPGLHDPRGAVRQLRPAVHDHAVPPDLRHRRVRRLFIAKMTLNIFSMIGIIMLMGLVTKNAILLVDFANQLRSAGQERRTTRSSKQASCAPPDPHDDRRDDFGMLPVALALSEGGETRAPMAVCVIGGLITSTH